MKLVVTAMVRDEADIIRQWIDFHVAQGVDKIIVTDNGSIDGTEAILQRYADRGIVDLRHDPVQRKQQGTVVTGMAREAYTLYGADWVVNADADEFLIPVDRDLTLRDVFSRLDPAIGSFGVHVVNMLGPVAQSGAGIDRLLWRDERTNDQLQQLGVLAQPTHNAVHVGAADVTVVQGNHFVSIASAGSPPEPLALEVLHLPWRSWEQLRHKAEISGRAYEANPELMPSPNHHGMLDYRRFVEGSLYYYYALRMITSDTAEVDTFTQDRSLPRFFAAHGLAGPYPSDSEASDHETRRAAGIGALLVRRDRDAGLLRTKVDEADAAAKARIAALQDHAEGLQVELDRIRRELTATKARREVKLADSLGDAARRIRR